MNAIGTRVSAYVFTINFLVNSPTMSEASTYVRAFVSYVEGTAMLQQAMEPYPEDATVNRPISPGDRVWTGPDSRVEIQFARNSVVRFAGNSRVNFEELGEEIVLHFQRGKMILQLADSLTRSRINTPTAIIYPEPDVRLRIDVNGARDAVDLTVYKGAAKLVSPQSNILVTSRSNGRGTTSYSPELLSYRSTNPDGFDTWSNDRDKTPTRHLPVPQAYESDSAREMEPSMDELNEHGEWRKNPSYGYIWYPHVSNGWTPYRAGRWCYTQYGYTWISYEPWGWSPYHYGGWYSSAQGWYWVPGQRWTSAKVSFSTWSNQVAWSLVGFQGGVAYGLHRPYGSRGGYNKQYKKYRKRKKGRHYYRSSKMISSRAHTRGTRIRGANRESISSRRVRAKNRSTKNVLHRRERRRKKIKPQERSTAKTTLFRQPPIRRQLAKSRRHLTPQSVKRTTRISEKGKKRQFQVAKPRSSQRVLRARRGSRPRTRPSPSKTGARRSHIPRRR